MDKKNRWFFPAEPHHLVDRAAPATTSSYDGDPSGAPERGRGETNDGIHVPENGQKARLAGRTIVTNRILLASGIAAGHCSVIWLRPAP